MQRYLPRGNISSTDKIKVKQNVVELVMDIWLMLLHTLRGQYEAIIGGRDVVIHKQQQF